MSLSILCNIKLVWAVVGKTYVDLIQLKVEFFFLIFPLFSLAFALFLSISLSFSLSPPFSFTRLQLPILPLLAFPILFLFASYTHTRNEFLQYIGRTSAPKKKFYGIPNSSNSVWHFDGSPQNNNKDGRQRRKVPELLMSKREISECCMGSREIEIDREREREKAQERECNECWTTMAISNTCV